MCKYDNSNGNIKVYIKLSKVQKVLDKLKAALSFCLFVFCLFFPNSIDFTTTVQQYETF